MRSAFTHSMGSSNSAFRLGGLRTAVVSQSLCTSPVYKFYLVDIDVLTHLAANFQHAQIPKGTRHNRRDWVELQSTLATSSAEYQHPLGAQQATSPPLSSRHHTLTYPPVVPAQKRFQERERGPVRVVR